MQLPRSLILRGPLQVGSVATNDMAARRQQLTTRPSAPAAPVQPLWEATRSAAPSSTSDATRIPAQIEAAIIATLTRDLHAGENHQTGNANRERELREIFARLDAVQAREILSRLDVDRSDDALARAFARIVIERRARLRAFLGDTRRRLALQGR